MIKPDFQFGCLLHPILFFLFASSSNPQEITGSITGRTTDTPGVPLSDVNLSAVVPRLIPDLLHIADQRKPVDIDQRKYLGDENGNLVIPNTTYRQAYRYQPAFSLRVGVEVGF